MTGAPKKEIKRKDGQHRKAIGRCALCTKERLIRDSHIIPAFVARWIKETSATGYLRGFHAPNRRRQDFPKYPLLCDECEERFSGAETQFARSIFLPFHDGRTRFQYEDWLIYFAVSLAWRCLAASSGHDLANHPQHRQAVEQAKAHWAAFLLKETTDIKPYRHNLFFTPAGVRSAGDLPEGVNSYLLRSPDGTPVFSRQRAATYVKLPGMFFWSSIEPPDPGGWRGTKISMHGTLQSKNQELSEPGVGEFLVDRIKVVRARMKTISPKQQALIDADIQRNPERFEKSRSREALLEDATIQEEQRRRRR